MFDFGPLSEWIKSETERIRPQIPNDLNYELSVSVAAGRCYAHINVWKGERYAVVGGEEYSGGDTFDEAAAHVMRKWAMRDPAPHSDTERAEFEEWRRSRAAQKEGVAA